MEEIKKNIEEKLLMLASDMEQNKHVNYPGNWSLLIAASEEIRKKDVEIARLNEEGQEVIDAMARGKELSRSIRWDGEPSEYDKLKSLLQAKEEELKKLVGLLRRYYQGNMGDHTLVKETEEALAQSNKL